MARLVGYALTPLAAWGSSLSQTLAEHLSEIPLVAHSRIHQFKRIKYTAIGLLGYSHAYVLGHGQLTDHLPVSDICLCGILVGVGSIAVSSWKINMHNLLQLKLVGMAKYVPCVKNIPEPGT